MTESGPTFLVVIHKQGILYRVLLKISNYFIKKCVENYPKIFTTGSYAEQIAK